MEGEAREKLRAFWNARYEAEGFAYGEAPNDFLVQCAPQFKPGGRVLCLADGEGRNGVWLAQQGFRVTSVDVADAGLAKAARLAAARGVALETRQADVTTMDLGEATWDAIVSIFLHLPAAERAALHARCLQALLPGGVFVFEAYTPEQLAFGTGGPKERSLLPTLADAEGDFAGRAARVVHRFSGVRHVAEGRLHHGDAHVAQLCLQRAVTARES